MKLRYYHVIIGVFSLLSVTACRKFVEIKTQGSLVPGDVNNYRALLNNTSAYESGPQIGDISSDDVQLVDGSTQQQALASDNYTYWHNSYTWQPVIYPLGPINIQTDNNWVQMYNTVTYCNVIINEVPGTNGTTAVKNELIAEALVHRADAYLMLANTYAKPYNASTAATDLGVPLIIKQTITQSLQRPPLQVIYNQILTDLKTALPNLLNTQRYNTVPSKASAYGELARCYLYMNDYSNAAKYADSALSIKSTLNDLGAITSISSATYPLRINDPEILLSKVASSGISAFAPYALRLSDDLLNLLGTKDQRYNLFTTSAATISSGYTAAGGRFFYKDRAIGEVRNIGPSVPEMMLIKAEYFARNNDPANAMLWVNNLRKKRFKAADYVPLTATTIADALANVINERRREFFCRMLRWWDMRRIKNEPQFQRTYSRIYNGTTYTLDPSSDRYTFQIAPYQLQLSPEIQQNP